MTISRLVLFLAFLASAAQAQVLRLAPGPMPDVLSPAPKFWWIAPQIGMNVNTHPGDFQPECTGCQFTNGSGNGVVLGIQVEHLITKNIGVAVKALYDDKRGTSTTVLQNVQRLLTENVMQEIDVERRYEVELAYVVVNPMLEVFPIRNLYLLAGPGIGFVVTSRYSGKEKLLEPGFVFASNGSDEVAIGTLENVDIPGVSAIRADFRVGIGYNLRLSPAVIFAPEVQYEIPLTTISSDNDWKVQTIRAVAVLKISL